MAARGRRQRAASSHFPLGPEEDKVRFKQVDEDDEPDESALFPAWKGYEPPGPDEARRVEAGQEDDMACVGGGRRDSEGKGHRQREGERYRQREGEGEGHGGRRNCDEGAAAGVADAPSSPGVVQAGSVQLPAAWAMS